MGAARIAQFPCCRSLRSQNCIPVAQSAESFDRHYGKPKCHSRASVCSWLLRDLIDHQHMHRPRLLLQFHAHRVLDGVEE